MVTINVTQDHIDKGKPNKANSCPVALALKEAFHTPKVIPSECDSSVEVTWEVARVGEMLFDLPSNAALFVKDFDTFIGHQRGILEPFSFELGVPIYFESPECEP